MRVSRPFAGVTTPLPVTLAVVLSARVPIIRHVPGPLRPELTALLTTCVQRYCDDPSQGNLEMLMALPKLTLRAVRLRGRRKAGELVSILAARLAAFRAGNLAGLWAALWA